MKKANLAGLLIVSLSLTIVVLVGYVITTSIDWSEQPPQEGFVILDKKTVRGGFLQIFGLGYEIPLFSYAEGKWIAVLQGDYDAYEIGDFWNGTQVLYG